MNASYNLDYDLAALLLFIIEIFYVRIQYSHDKYRNRLFITLLHSSFLLTIVDMVSSLLLTKYAKVAPAALTRGVSDIYFVTNALVFLVFYRYMVEYLGDRQERTVGYYIRTYFPFVFIVEGLIANHYVNIFFSGGKYGHFSYGSLILIIYIYPVYYFLLTIICMIRNRKRINIRQSVSVIAYMVITIVSILIQLFYADIMSLAFGYALSMLIMLFTFETPDYKKLIKANDLLETVREEQEQRDMFDKALIEYMSDEICTPIERMLDKNESYPFDALDENQKEIYAYIEGYGRQVRSVINNMIEYNRLDAAMDEFEVDEYSVRDLIKEACDVVMPAIKDNSDTFNMEIDSNVPEMLSGTGLLLKQIIINLIRNAVKNTHAGTITFTVNSRRTTRDNINLIISVEDDGIGMNRETVKKLLQFNTKGRNWRKEVFDGGNFRVRITKKMVEQMNGKINIDSAVGKGSVFTVVIPQSHVDGG